VADADVVLAHISDLHFGRDCDLLQIEALERFLPTLGVTAFAISGDLTQRARHGEFQAAHAFSQRLRDAAPLLVIPGNHDVQWWASPFGVRGSRPLYAKYRRYFGDDLTPTLELPGAVIASALTSYGVAFGSLTPRLRDMAVKGHLPRREIERVKAIFARAPAGAARVLVLHHNVLPGKISGRMGLARWRRAQRSLQEIGADVLLTGHDHQEGAGQVAGRLAVSSAGTHTSRTRGGRPSVFNLVRIDSQSIHIQHYRWEVTGRRFLPSDRFTFVRGSGQQPAVSVAGGEDPI
jgi:3',5'-cyclic AMP phosphodiesterase CpdA